MQKNAISYYKYVEYAGIRQKNILMISPKLHRSIKNTEYAEKLQYCHPPIQDTSFTHI